MALNDIIERFEAETTINEDGRVSFFEMLTPAFYGGVIIGLLAGIPGISLLVFLFPIGGYLAVKMVKDYYEKNVNMRDAAKVGAFAGLLGGFFSSLMLVIFAIFFADGIFTFFKSMIGTENAVFIMTLSGIDPNISFYTMRLRFLVNIVLCTILGCIGGVIFSIRSKR